MLFLKNEDILKSAPIIAFQIMKYLKDKSIEKVSLFDIAEYMSKKSIGVKSIYYGMIFLYATGLIRFEAPYIVSNYEVE